MYLTLTSHGNWVTRRQLFTDAAQFYLTNNAASEVRAKYGVTVEHKLIDGEHCYRLLSQGREPPVGSPPDIPSLAEQSSAGLAQAADPPSPVPLAVGQLSLT